MSTQISQGGNIMNPAFGIVLMLSILSLAGCATPTSEFNKASKINSVDSYKAYLKKYPYSPYTRKAKNRITELTTTENKKYQLKKYWGRLSKGMSVDEVDALIGPLNRSAVISIKNLAKSKNASSGANDKPKPGAGFPYRTRLFTLKFGANGRLSEWSLTLP